MSDDRIFVGSGKQTHEKFVNISVCLTDLPKEHMFEYNGKKYIKLTVGKKNDTDKFGKTHYVAVNTYKKEETTETVTVHNPEVPEQPEQEEDLIF